MSCFELPDLQLTVPFAPSFRTEIGLELITAGSQVRILSTLTIAPFGGLTCACPSHPVPRPGSRDTSDGHDGAAPWPEHQDQRVQVGHADLTKQLRPALVLYEPPPLV